MVALSSSCSPSNSSPDDGGTNPDVGSADSGGDSGPTTYSALDDKTKWSIFSPTGVNEVDYQGVAFDGRYVYFAPSANIFPGSIQRYDTQGAFTAQLSWTAFDPTTINASSTSFGGIVFDGRYLYFVPSAPTAQAGQSVVLRYDTQAAFVTTASWATFDIALSDPTAKGFMGGTFDGRYVYFAPFEDNLNPQGHTVRYDTKAAFGSKSSWTSINLKSFQAYANGFNGAAFDGRYVYYAPFGSTSAMQYDTQAPISSPTAWVEFAIDTLTTAQTIFQGVVYDGKYIYLVPATGAVVARYDTTASLGFAADSSWTTFDAQTVNAGAGNFFGGVFDGRYVYFIPQYNMSSLSGYITRYDTTTDFETASSWSTFDTSVLDPDAQGFSTGAFDGRYVYFGSFLSGLIARFDSKSPPSLPGLPGGSSY